MKFSVRQPVVTGAFYPAHPDNLIKAVNDFMKNARARLMEKPMAIIVPHAGYVFSGQVCADAFNQVANEQYDVIVILGTNHSRGGWRKNGVYYGLGFQTPLGLAEIDRTIAEAIVKDNPDCVYDNDIHAREHSIEVVLPFVKVLFPDAKIVPIVVGDNDLALCEGLGATLAKVLKGKRALIVASTDLSHYPTYKDAVSVDGEVIKATLTMDAKAVKDKIARLMAKGVSNLSTCACGEATILATINAARAMGADEARLISYANSGDSVFADRKRVVGYMAVVFGKGAMKDKSTSTADDSGKSAKDATRETPNKKEQGQMLKIARETLARYLSSQSVPLPRDCEPYLQNYRGLFVTLKKKGMLRGCIGEIEPSAPLCQLIGRVALQSALEDPRFPHVSFGELADIEIEISLLTPPREVAGVDDIVLGRDGVIINKNGKGALFLPQVAPEQGWTKDVWLTQLSLKAGLPPDAWRGSKARFLTFQAIVFEEGPPHSKDKAR